MWHGARECDMTHMHLIFSRMNIHDVFVRHTFSLGLSRIKHTHTHAHTVTHTHTLTHTHTHTHSHIHTHTHTHTFFLDPSRIKHLHTHTQTHAHTHIRTHTHTLSLTHTHMHTHMQMHTQSIWIYQEQQELWLFVCRLWIAHCPSWRYIYHCKTLQQNATHCNTLQHTLCVATRMDRPRWRYSQSYMGWPFRKLSPSSKLKARTSLCTETWQKRRSSLELWALKQLSKMSPHVGSAVPVSLQNTAPHCNTLQYTTAHSLYLHTSCISTCMNCPTWRSVYHCKTLQDTATHCNTLPHTATHFSALQNTLCISTPFVSWFVWIAQDEGTFVIATHCKTLATHCNTLQHTATHCNTLQHTASHRNTLQHTATHSLCLDLYGLPNMKVPL